MRSFKTIAATVALLFAILTSLIVVRQINTGATLILSNDTNLTMKGVSVELPGYGAARNLGDIKPGTDIKVRFKDYGDSCWLLRIQDYDGSPIQEQAGYVTNGLNNADTLTLDSSKVWQFESTSWHLFPPLSGF